MKYRILLGIGLLAAATQLPVFSGLSASAWQKVRQMGASPAADVGRLSLDEGLANGSNRDRRGNPVGAVATHRSDVPLEGPPIHDLAEVLRLDITAPWVYTRWSRKTTALADLSLYGVRVPLVTGTEVDDLAGSLTYYFNPAGQVQRISFRGRTGDTRKLVALVVSRFGFRLQPPVFPGEQLYQVKWNGKPISELRIRPASVLWANTPHSSFEVQLELERPGSGRFLEREVGAAVSRAGGAEMTK